MNQLDHSDLDIHVRVLGWLYIAGNGLFLLLGICGLILLAGVGSITQDQTANSILVLVGTIGAVCFTGLSLPGMLTGYGLLRRTSWARILALVIAVLNLALFPIGTALGIYTFFVLFQESAQEYFTNHEINTQP